MDPVGYRYALVCEYDGGDFAGFQTQKDRPTIQAALESALSTVLRTEIRVQCAGRTDAGVHASGQVVSFSTPDNVEDCDRLLRSLNALLPPAIAVQKVIDVPPRFHARFSCVAREYEYLIWNRPERSVHLRGRALWFRNPLPVEELDRELQEIRGERDFVALTKMEYRGESTIRYLDRISLFRSENSLNRSTGLVILQIRGNAFLHNMIRILVGTLLERSRGRIRGTVREVVDSGNRLLAGPTIGPEGLYFRRAYYQSVSGAVRLPLLDDYPVFRVNNRNIP